MGILEAFSARSYAFGAEHVSVLKRLAEIAQAAYEAESVPAESPPEPRSEPTGYSRIRPDLFMASTAALTPTAAAPNDQRISAEPFAQRWFGTRRYWIAGAIVLLLLTGAVVWTTWHEPDEDGSSQQQVTQSQHMADELATSTGPAVIPWKPPAGQPRVRINPLRPSEGQSNPNTAEPLLRNAAEIETDKRVQDAGSPGTVVEQESPGLSKGTLDPPTATLDSMPVAPASTSAQAIADLVSTPPALPASDLRVSQGVSQATLMHKVEPLYPAEARRQRVGGAVVLEVTIAEDGSTQDVKVISGLPLLTRAATDAIRQWRYRPALLNGKPTAVQKQITVIFQAP